MPIGFGSPDSQTLKAYIDTKSEEDFHDEEEVGQLSQIGSGNTGMFSRLLETAYESVNVMLSPSTKAKKYCTFYVCNKFTTYPNNSTSFMYTRCWLG